MNKISSFFSIVVFAISLSVVTGCGGSSSDSASVSVINPPDGSTFSAGESFTLSLAVDNFTFNRPTGADPAITGTQTGTLSALHTRHGDDEHGATATNPSATQGHVHIYLDDGSGMDSHITAWSTEVSVALPTELAVGTHSLRIEMRDDNHVKLGSDRDEYFLFQIQ